MCRKQCVQHPAPHEPAILALGSLKQEHQKSSRLCTSSQPELHEVFLKTMDGLEVNSWSGGGCLTANRAKRITEKHTKGFQVKNGKEASVSQRRGTEPAPESTGGSWGCEISN